MPIDFKFQSTPSAWRETKYRSGHIAVDVISIHSLRMEGDDSQVPQPRPYQHFNPLPPHGGRRRLIVLYSLRDMISIHSLRMEGDNTVISGTCGV